MGTFFISARLKRDPAGSGMYFSGTPTAVNAAGIFAMMRPVVGVPPPPPPAPAPSPAPTPAPTPAPAPAMSPLNAGYITAANPEPSSASAIWLTSKGAVFDGATNNIVAIRNAISAAALTTHKRVWVSSGTCAYTGTITASSVTIDGAGPSFATLLGQDPTQRSIWLKGASPGCMNVALFTTSATARAAPWEYVGIVLNGCSNFTVSNVYIKHCEAAGIQTIASAGPGLIAQSTISGTLADSIHMTDQAHDIIVQLNLIMKSGDDGIACISYSYDGGKVKNIEARYNWIKDNLQGRCMSIVGGQNIRYHNNLMQNNVFNAGLYIAQEIGYQSWGVNGFTADYNTIINCGNTANGHASVMIFSDGTYVNDSITLLRNDIQQDGIRNGIRYFGPQTNVLLDSNKITNAATAYVGGTTAGVTTIPYASGNVGYQFTTPTSVESPDGTTIPSAASITDSGLHVWTVANGVVSRDNVATISSSVTLLLYYGRKVYQQNSFGSWWYWDDNVTSGNPWTATTDPRVSIPVQPAITTNRHPNDFLQAGNLATGAYWIHDNRWGASGFTEASGQSGGGPAADGFPQRILGAYWEAYNAGASYVTLLNISTKYNVVYLFNARFNSDGSLSWPFSVPSSTVQTLRGRGQKVMLTCGGAGITFNFQLRAQSDAFIASFKTIAASLGGVDGCDFNNYEGMVLNAAFITEMVYIAQQLKAFYGSSFGITTPAGPINTGGAPVNGISMTNNGDLSLCGALADAGYLTYAAPQYYDWSFYKQSTTIRQINQQWVNRLGASRVALGLGAGNYNTANATLLTEANPEWDACVSANPAERGVFSWNADFDNQQGFAFANNFANKFSAIGVTSGTISPSFYTQAVERALTAGPNGQVAFRTQWSWPFSVSGVTVDGNSNFSEVKGFPCVIYGASPGFKGTGKYPAGEKVVRLPDGVVVTAAPADAPGNAISDWVQPGGSVSQVAPSGATPGNPFPRKLPLSAGSSIVTGRFSASATGKSHVTFDIWLQAPANPTQTSGFANSPITHEVMIPLHNFGGYGQYPSGRPAGWYDHDVTIDNVLYHVYGAKSSDGALRYDFGSLNGNYTNEETGAGRTGWKFIVFQHDGVAHPLQPDGSFRIDLGKIINHLSTVLDSRNIAWVQGTENVVSVELGVEPVVGAGDCILWDYRII